jgi:signal transduction histidine kinase
MLLDRFFRLRRAAVIGSLLIMVYCNLYMWLFVPFHTFEFNWRPDHKLHVTAVSAESPAAPYLRAGDHIIAIDGRPAQRTSIIYPPTVRQIAYELTLERDGNVSVATVPFLAQPDFYAIQLRAAAAILALITWVVGAVVLHFAWKENRQAIWLGGIFLLSSVAVISWNATLIGVPFAWLTSQPLLFLLGVGWVYLGCLPRYSSLPDLGRLALKILTGISIVLSAVALGEGIFLFPRGSSIQAITGISVYQMAALSQALGGIVMFVLLLGRRITVDKGYLRQQLNILLVFVGIGFLPAVLFSFLPLGLWGRPMLPVPMAILGLIMVPLGYIYVIFRHAYLGLDGAFGRSTPYLLLVLLLTAIYGLTLRALDGWFAGDLNLILPATLMFVVLAALAPQSKSWLELWIHDLFFGRSLDTQSRLRQFTDDLAHQPEMETLERVIRNICSVLDISKTTFFLKNGNKVLKSLIEIGTSDWPKGIPEAWLPEKAVIRTVQRRRATPHPLLAALPWAEIALPIRAREQILGVWVLARPRDGFFNQEQISFLEHAAATLAMGAEIVFLLDSAEKLSRRIITVQEAEQRAFASRLHDHPLQTLSSVRMTMAQLLRESHEQTDGAGVLPSELETLKNVASHLSSLEFELRNVYEDAFPKILEYGIGATVLKLIDQFRELHDLVIDYDLNNLDDVEERSSDQMAQVVYHVLRESLNNVVKHSDATEVDVAAKYQDDMFQMTVRDNGRKPNLSAELSPSELLRQRHFGIVGMKAWAKSLSGDLTVAYNDLGTCVTLILPVP